MYFEKWIRVQGFEAVDTVLLACYALHNWLLGIDGLDGDWESQTIPIAYQLEGELCEVDY